MSKAENPVCRTLDDDYELKQLNPVYSGVTDGKPSYDAIPDLAKKIPETAHLKMRVATFEAIVESVVEEVLDKTNDGETDIQKVEDAIEPVVEKAIALHLVPSFVRDDIRRMVAKHLRTKDPVVALHSSVAHRIANDMVRMEDNACVVEEVLDTGDTVDENKDVDIDVEKEVITTDERTVEVDESVPEELAKSMRYVAAASVNHRKSIAIASRKYAGPMVTNMLHELRHVLPDWYCAKYRVR